MKTRPPQPPLALGSLQARCARLLRGAPVDFVRRLRLRRGPSGLAPQGFPSVRAARRPDSVGPAAAALGLLFLAACGTPAPRPAVERAEPVPPVAKPAPAKVPAPAYVLRKGGGYYQDDGPGDSAPENLDAIPDAVPRDEPPHRYANKPYSVLGRDYVPLPSAAGYRARGVASWYGRKFHGQKTSSGEPYDMYGMTAAHTTLPIPSYARVTNPANGRSVVVRINDRGPFHAGRLIDLSYTAAAKLGYIGSGSTLVEVASVQPGQEVMVAAAGAPADDDPIARFANLPDPAPLPEVRDARGTYVQLGAFGNADNAEALKNRLARELGSLGDRLAVRAGGGMYRVQLGPWADRDEAQRMAARVAETLELTPLVVQR